MKKLLGIVVLLPGAPNFNYNYVDQYGRNKIND